MAEEKPSLAAMFLPKESAEKEEDDTESEDESSDVFAEFLDATASAEVRMDALKLFIKLNQ